jgi:hypothetical protein
MVTRPGTWDHPTLANAITEHAKNVPDFKFEPVFPGEGEHGVVGFAIHPKKSTKKRRLSSTGSKVGGEKQ